MKRIGLMDCNNFFVSCERLFRPDLTAKPVAVLSSNDGCIVARSQEVKDLGIPMGVPYFQVRDLCKKEGITLFSSNFRLYRDISQRVMRVLTEAFDTYEIYSVDEAFFELPSDMPVAELRALRERVLRDVGIPVSIGVGATKTIAKCAATYAKKGDGVYVMDEKTWEQEQKNIPCGSVWGIGRQTTAKLTADNVHTVEGFLRLDPAFVRKQFGVGGERKQLELSGTSVYAVGEESDPEHQSMMSTRSFRDTTHAKADLQNAIGYHVTELCRKLRERGFVASRIHVTARPGRQSDFAYRTHGADGVLDAPTDSTAKILQRALELLDTCFDPEVPYKKAGITLSGIMPKSYAPQSLFDAGEQTDAVESVVDSINTRYGKGTVRPGVVTSREGLHTSAALRSQEYTTSWSEIKVIKAI